MSGLPSTYHDFKNLAARDGDQEVLVVIIPGTDQGQPCISYMVGKCFGQADVLAHHHDDEIRVTVAINACVNMHHKALTHGIQPL